MSAGLLWYLMLFGEKAPLTRSTPRGSRISHVFGKGYEGRTHTMQRFRGSLHCTSDEWGTTIRRERMYCRMQLVLGRSRR